MSLSRSVPVRSNLLCAALIALLLAVRLLTPAGFMPAFEHGRMTIVLCPEAAPMPAPTMGHHGPGHGKHQHPQCPFAAASSLGGVAAGGLWVTPLLVLVPALLIGHAGGFIPTLRAHERPPLRGPPLPA